MDKYLEEDLVRIAEKCGEFKDLSGKSILVTGATGLVGSMIVKAFVKMNELMDAGIKILAMIRDENKADVIYNDVDKSSIEYLVGDLSDSIRTDCDVDYIIHTASPTASKFFVEHPVETLGIAIDGVRNVLDFAKNKKVKGVVYLSSMEAFGNVGDMGSKVKEDTLGYIDIHSVRSSYSEGKRVCELLCSCYAAEYGVPVKIARLAQTFGAGIPYTENRVFAQFAKSAINKTDIVLHTKGLSEGNYCYTADAIIGIITILVKGENGEAYTVVNEETHTTIAGMAKMVADKIADGEIKLVFDIPEDALTYGYAPDVKLFLSSEKLNSLGWKAEISLEEAYRRMIASMLASR